MLRLELRHYKAILALKNSKTTAQVAERLGLTSSAVSHQLTEVERRLGQKLITRVGRNLFLNNAGNQLAETATRILKEAGRIENVLLPLSDSDSPCIVRYGVFAQNSHRWLTKFYAPHNYDGERFAFEVIKTGICYPPSKIATGEIDLGLIGGNFHDPLLEAVEIFEDNLVCVMPKGHKLTERPFAVPEDFLVEPFITHSTLNEGGFEEDQFFTPAGVHPKQFLLGGDVETIQQMVKHGYGLSILSQWTIDCSPFYHDVHYIPLTEFGLRVKWYMVFRRSDENYDHLKTGITRLQKWCEKEQFPKRARELI